MPKIRQIQSQKICGRRSHDALRALDQLDRRRAKNYQRAAGAHPGGESRNSRHGSYCDRSDAVLGPYDFVNIVEAPDAGAITRLSVELGSRGTLQVMSMPAMPLDDFIATIKSS